MGLGPSELTTGGGRALTVRATLFDDLPFEVTWTDHIEAATPTLTDTRICEAVTEATCEPCKVVVDPEEVRTTFSPLWKPLPLMVNVWFDADPVMGFGATDVMTGGTGAEAGQFITML